MRFLHLADLHLGKKVNEFSMIEDQKYILKQILNIIDEKEVEAVLIAGDVYDKSVPSAEAVILLDDFLNNLAKRQLKTFIISGNHDSPERVGFGADIMSLAGIYMAKPFSGAPEKVTLSDKSGKINIYMLPFIKPAIVKHFYKDEEVATYEDAMELVMKNTKIDKRQRNILIAHQYVSGATRCDSENMPIGGIDEVSAKNFEGFDYVALGHLHGPQHIEKETIRYAGTPLKYSFSEINHKKSALIVDVKKKGDVEFEKIPLKPLHDMVEIKGLYDELTAKSFYENMDAKSYIHVTLTDEEDKPNAMELLRTIYPNIMKLDYDNKRTRENQVVNGVSEIENKSKHELFEEFFELQNNQKMNDKQRKIIDDLINKIWG